MMPMTSDSFMIEELFAVDLDLGAGPFSEEDAVAGLDVERLNFSAFVAGARADGDDLAFLRLLLGGVRNDDPALGLLFGFKTADDNSVVKWPEMHVCSSRPNGLSKKGFCPVLS